MLDIMSSVFLFFFFSSRRRHTRLQGDWSSDVCSSDLVEGFMPAPPSCSRSVPFGVSSLSDTQAAARVRHQRPHLLRMKTLVELPASIFIHDETFDVAKGSPLDVDGRISVRVLDCVESESRQLKARHGQPCGPGQTT